MLLKRIAAAIVFAGITTAFAATSYADAVPLRVGPVSLYGALGTSGNKIVSISNSKQVMLRGMSFFWSDDTGMPYYTADVVNYAANTLKMDVLRFAMAIQYYNSSGSASEPITLSYVNSPATQKTALDDMVTAAIENDIYLIIDWHSHRAEYETASALAFFTYAAERYKNIPNVIWEVYNEPVSTSWSSIKDYADQVIGAIRTYSPNLALVGTRNWSQNPQEANGNAVNATNVAYVFHFYAATHSKSSFSSNIESALNSGHPVFISEWGTTDANGTGSVSSSESATWISYMESLKISNCNWSLRQYTSQNDASTEASALFTGDSALNTKAKLNAAAFTTSGTIAKNYLTSYGRNWEDSLTAGYRSGSCAFAHQKVNETIGTISNIANSSCTYTSSNEAVATISGGVITVKKAGFAVMTGNDNTQSVITALAVAGQTFFLESYVCRLAGTCDGTDRLKSYSSTTQTAEQKSQRTTTQGATVTITSSDPSVISVAAAQCNGTNCTTTMSGQDIFVFHFNALGHVQMHATAPAYNGYKALDTTITMQYRKNIQRMASTFKNSTLALGQSVDMLPDTTIYEQASVNYVFAGGDVYATKSGTYLVAGNLNATITVTAFANETTNYEALGYNLLIDSASGITRTIIIGTGELDVGISVSEAVVTPLKAGIYQDGIYLELKNSGVVTIQFLDIAGRHTYKTLQDNYTAGNHYISLNNLPMGHYIVRIQQGSRMRSIPLIKN